jgi:hypothetical protein
MTAPPVFGLDLAPCRRCHGGGQVRREPFTRDEEHRRVAENRRRARTGQGPLPRPDPFVSCSSCDGQGFVPPPVADREPTDDAA